uniref:ERCC4 domain-containing protein n=1 Tax=viral metagenome TaxID=1070528 RepID=A0A6C0H2T3_9ZZZZ
MIELVIDNREQELIQKLKPISPLVEQLDVGDILFRKDKNTVLIIERKTVNDLKASICDGRGREQKARLLGSTPRQRIIYLVEGSLDKPLSSKISGLPVSTLIGSLINTQLRDGIKVYKTSTIDESAEFIIKLLDKLEKDGETYFRDEEYKSSDESYSATLKKSKKANMTPNLWFITQLSLIPQVTEKVSSVIVEKYSNLQNLMKEYETTPEHLREKLVADLTFPLSTGGSRRIGDTISKRIYHFLFGIT